jgi:hypothetical protein
MRVTVYSYAEFEDCLKLSSFLYIYGVKSENPLTRDHTNNTRSIALFFYIWKVKSGNPLTRDHTSNTRQVQSSLACAPMPRMTVF